MPACPLQKYSQVNTSSPRPPERTHTPATISLPAPTPTRIGDDFPSYPSPLPPTHPHTGDDFWRRRLELVLCHHELRQIVALAQGEGEKLELVRVDAEHFQRIQLAQLVGEIFELILVENELLQVRQLLYFRRYLLDLVVDHLQASEVREQEHLHGDCSQAHLVKHQVTRLPRCVHALHVIEDYACHGVAKVSSIHARTHDARACHGLAKVSSIHARTHDAHTHARTHARTHAQTRTHKHARTHA